MEGLVPKTACVSLPLNNKQTVASQDFLKAKSTLPKQNMYILSMEKDWDR